MARWSAPAASCAMACGSGRGSCFLTVAYVSRPMSKTCWQGRSIDPQTCSHRSWTPEYPLDLRAVLAPLRRGRDDPTMRVDADATVWRASTTPAGAATLALRRANGTVHATAWGPGAIWALDGLPALLGADDDDSGFVSHHALIAQARRRMPGLRLGATCRVWDV